MTRHTLMLALIDGGNPLPGGEVVVLLVLRNNKRIDMPVELG